MRHGEKLSDRAGRRERPQHGGGQRGEPAQPRRIVAERAREWRLAGTSDLGDRDGSGRPRRRRDAQEPAAPWPPPRAPQAARAQPARGSSRTPAQRRRPRADASAATDRLWRAETAPRRSSAAAPRRPAARAAFPPARRSPPGGRRHLRPARGRPSHPASPGRPAATGSATRAAVAASSPPRSRRSRRSRGRSAFGSAFEGSSTQATPADAQRRTQVAPARSPAAGGAAAARPFNQRRHAGHARRPASCERRGSSASRPDRPRGGRAADARCPPRCRQPPARRSVPRAPAPPAPGSSPAVSITSTPGRNAAPASSRATVCAASRPEFAAQSVVHHQRKQRATAPRTQSRASSASAMLSAPPDTPAAIGEPARTGRAPPLRRRTRRQ